MELPLPANVNTTRGKEPLWEAGGSAGCTAAAGPGGHGDRHRCGTSRVQYSFFRAGSRRMPCRTTARGHKLASLDTAALPYRSAYLEVSFEFE